MSQASSISARKRFGLQRICRITRVGRSTVYAQRHLESTPEADRPRLRRRGPLGACPDDELVGHIRQVLVDSPFHGEG